MRNVKYDFSSCHIELPTSLAEDIINWGRTEVHDDDLYVTQKDPTFGREDEMHITILYGIYSDSPDQIKTLIKGFGPIKVELGSIDVFSNNYKFDVVMIDVYSQDLRELNKELESQIKHKSKYPVYTPHVTIAYVKKGKGWKYRGNKKWEGKQFTCNHVVFSSKNGGKERIAT